MNMKIFQLDSEQVALVLAALGESEQSAAAAEYATGEQSVRCLRADFDCQARNQPDTEVWHRIEWSHKGANDWYTLGSGTFDSIEGARDAKRDNDESSTYSAAFDYRIVKATLISEVVE